MNSKFQKLINKYKPSGSYFVYKDEKLVFNEYFGYQDIEEKIKFNDQTLIRFSIYNNLIVMVSMMQLYEKKQFKFSDKISKYIPEYKEGNKITIKQLLQHQSLIIDFFSGHIMKEYIKTSSYNQMSFVDKARFEILNSTKDYKANEVIDIINQYELNKKPGSEFEFTKTTPLLVSILVERISKTSYEEYVFENIIKPLDLEIHTKSINEASDYDQTDDTKCFKVNISNESKKYYLLETKEYIKIFNGIIKNKIITKESWKIMTTFKEDVGIGVYGNEEIELSLGFGKHSISAIYNPKLELMVIFASNYEGDYILEHGSWFYFESEAKDLITNNYIYPNNPYIEKFNDKNRYDFYDIMIKEEQEKYVPNVYKCIAYSYKKKDNYNYVLKDYGVPIGMFTLVMNKKNKLFEIRFFQIDKLYQNRGYGKIMLEKAIEILKQQGAKKLEIGLVAENIPAYKTYKSLGFLETDVSSDFIMLEYEVSYD
ncbi:GNAT family N-acetyltransferase [Haploplasma axanthum]|uniref:Ribosomal-protein-alanine N-acetyltransferase n=1 Tax=Haploplasma axanthum TaxID=29552 RepID=A0A449BD49_HAPAX|nr:GNAT family N-acetyltransferase [Haploplasma axanthum]VEU80391.1 ribosomal-protein-alanine N-acetyltransferase [Haploplasma axanthum]